MYVSLKRAWVDDVEVERRRLLVTVCSMACLAESRSRPHIGPTSPLSLTSQVNGDCQDTQRWLSAKGGRVVVADYHSCLLLDLTRQLLGFDPDSV